MAQMYSPHPAVQIVIDWVNSLKEKTGKSLPEWLALIENNGPKTEAARRDWLKREYKFGTNSAWWLAERSVGKGSEDDSPEGYLQAAAEWVDKMYVKKQAIKPIHDAIIEYARNMADDVRVCPCQTIVPLYRNHVFAQIKPSTKERLDLGLWLAPLIQKGDTDFPERLVSTGGYEKKDRITHCFQLTSLKDFDGEVKKWLKRAYSLDKPEKVAKSKSETKAKAKKA
jgi:hypothetical protein